MTEKKGGCCNDEVKFFKLADNFKNNNTAFHSFESKAILPSTQLEIYFTPAFVKAVSSTHLPEKPEQYGPPLFVRNRVFRI